MKVLLLNGSTREKGCTFTALSEVETVLNDAGIETEMIQLGSKPVQDCIACLHCKKAGQCVFDDRVNEVAKKMETADGLVVGSAVYYAGPTGQLCSFLDRLFYSAGGKFAGKAAAAVVSCRRGGATAAFDRLNKYFTICNMSVIGSQYWNQVHGSKPEDVKNDGEGMQTMRVLGQNMVYWLQNKQAGQQNGVTPPSYEKRLWTNFIR